MPKNKNSTSAQEAAVGVVLSQDRKKVLLVKRRDLPVWVIPGGGIDPGEDPAVAAAREVQEETGYTVRPLRKTADYQPSAWCTARTHVYLCEIVSGSARLSDESQAVGFHTVDSLPQPFFPMHRYWLEDVLLGKSEIIHTTLSVANYPGFLVWLLRHPFLVSRYLIGRFLRSG